MVHVFKDVKWIKAGFQHIFFFNFPVLFLYIICFRKYSELYHKLN